MFWWRHLSLLTFLAGSAASTTPFAAQDARATILALEPRTVLEGRLSGGETVRLSLGLGVDQSAAIAVTHHDIDVVVRVFDGEGEPDIEKASDGATGELRVVVSTAGTEPLRIEIAAAYPKGAPGRYGIHVEDARAVTPSDRLIWDAGRVESRARRLAAAASYPEAVAHAERALSLWEKAIDRQAPEVAQSLLLLGQLHDRMARFETAEGFYLRAERIIRETDPRRELMMAETLDSRTANLSARGRFQDAEALVTEALAIRKRLLGPDHFLVAVSLGTLADLHHERGNVQGARSAAERALEVAAKAYRPADVAYGDFLNRVARAQLAMGNYGRAEELYRESLSVRENSLGAESLAAGESLTGLARAAMLKNDNVTAEQLLRRTLAIKERMLGPDHLEIAFLLHNAALIHYRRRDYQAAVALNSRSLALKEKALGPVNRHTKSSLNNLGLVYWRQGDYRRAEDAFQRSLEIGEALSGPDNLELAAPLANLGIIAKERGHYDLAEARYKRAVAIREQHLGPDHPELIVPIESLGILYRDRGEYARAGEMFDRVVRITASSLGPEHPFVARHLDNVVHLHWAQGNWPQAFLALQRVLAIEERNLPLNLSVGSERQKLAYFEPRLRNLEEMISFHVEQPADPAGARDLAITALFQRKGRILDALADSLSAFRNRARPEDAALLDELTRATSKLAAAALSDATQSPLGERQRSLAALTAERERLEMEVHRRSAGYLEPSTPLTFAEVQRAVPADAALVEFAIYRPFNARASVESGKQFAPPRYIAYVVRHGGEAQWKDLGPAADINAATERFRNALADPTRPDAIRLARDLHQRLVAPLRPVLGDATHLLVSPDGPLNLIPFEALRSADGRYLVEDVAISYVTTGRDLVRMVVPRPTGSRAVIFADPAFGAPSPQPMVRATTSQRAASRARRRSILAGQDLTSVYFAPLAGTASEAQRIHALFPDMELRLRARATERALKSLQAPRILHVATHGFFLQYQDAAEGSRASGGTRTPNATARIENPLLRSGLAFAGANSSRTGEDDGILTALEAANLNLWGTKLVTLSACDTGVGVVRNGEGVYGLRRAFFLAGAESLVMSLWPVSDLITRQLMTGYYAGLKEGLGRGAALRRMQLQMLKRKGRAHPFYWASFIHAGEWANLDGQR